MAGGAARRGTEDNDPRMVVTAPHPLASTRRRSVPSTVSYRSRGTSAQNPSSRVHGRSERRSARESMYPSPYSQPTTSSGNWWGVHIQVTALSPFTSSHTGASSTESCRVIARAPVSVCDPLRPQCRALRQPDARHPRALPECVLDVPGNERGNVLARRHQPPLDELRNVGVHVVVIEAIHH